MGVYAPSPGTIYPRLARLEEDGLVTHEEVDGKKVYSITDKGREEIRSRLGDLADLEDELTESLREVAKGISEDVRDTVRTIREELASAAREFRSDDGKASREQAEPGGPAGDSAGPQPGDEARRIREEARRSREQMRASFRGRARQGDWSSWQNWSDRSPWSAWSDWTGGRDEPGDVGEANEAASSGASGQAGPGARGKSRRGGQNPFSDLERMAIQFATELRAAAKQTGDLGERSLSDLRDILTDTLAKVRVEVFADTGSGDEAGSGSADAAASPDQGQDDGEAKPAAE